MTDKKIFIIGLPRTATTSVCVSLLELGYKTAHTAYTQHALDNAEAIADTPIFCDYQKLDSKYANAKYVYLTRDMSLWVPSIRQLLLRMFKNLQRTDGGFNPTLKRCYNEVFSPLTIENINNDDFLISCFERHQAKIFSFFKERENDLLTIDVSNDESFGNLMKFLGNNISDMETQNFRPINMGGKVTAWKKIKHINKVESTYSGRIDKV